MNCAGSRNKAANGFQPKAYEPPAKANFGQPPRLPSKSCFRCGRSTHRIAECNEIVNMNGNPTKPKRNPKEKLNNVEAGEVLEAGLFELNSLETDDIADTIRKNIQNSYCVYSVDC